MTDNKRNETLFEDQVWKLQIEASRLALLMDEMRRDKLVLNLTGKYWDWIVILKQEHDHADDERRASHGS